MLTTYYPIDEYPNPLPQTIRSFPLPSGTGMLIKIDGCDDTAFCDGFMLDLKVRLRDIERFRRLNLRVVSRRYIQDMAEGTEYKYRLLAPKYVMECDIVAYICPVEGKEDNFVGIQVGYYTYWKTKSKKHEFYVTEKQYKPIAVKLKDELVGIVMPVVIDLAHLREVLATK